MSQAILFNPIADPKRITFTIPPWALIHIGTALENSGYSVTIIDQNVDRSWKDTLKSALDEKTIFIGITAMTGMQLHYVMEFIDYSRRLSKVPIVWGGGHASFFPSHTLRSGYADIIVKGEGESTIVELAQAIENRLHLESVKGIWYLENGQIKETEDREFIDMDTIPRLSYHLVDMERYIFKTGYAKRNLEICSSRGCTHGCIFCYNIVFNKKTWRGMSAQRVIAELKFLKEAYRIDGLNWREDNFFVDKARVEEICKLMIEMDLRIRWHADARIDYVDQYDDSFIDLMKKAGLSRITFGIESGSKRMLNVVQKGITIEQILRVNKRMAGHKLPTYYHFSFGHIGETMEDSEETVKLVLQILKDNPHASLWPASLYTPYPGTPMFKLAEKQGFEVPDEMEGFLKFIWATPNLPWISDEYAKQLRDTVYILTGYASNIPIVKSWFKFRMRQIVKYGKPARLIERPLADRIRKAIMASKRWFAIVPQISS